MPTTELTGERLARIETSLKHQEEKLTSIEDKLDAFTAKADDKYAHRSELNDLKRVVWGVLGTLGAAIVGVVVKLIFFP